MTASQNKVTKKRRTRRLKNGYIDISDVNDEPGHQFCEWIKISKQKLKVQ